MAKFNSAKDVRRHVRAEMGLPDRGRVEKSKQDEYEERCKEICAEYGFEDWEVRRVD
jgi:hypothetical protein